MTTADQVTEILRTADLSTLRQYTVADSLGIPEYTLRKRLAREGTRYCDLLEAERKRRCAQVLERYGRRAYAKVLAHELGYIEVNSFCRAFRSWYGQHFSDVRKEL